MAFSYYASITIDNTKVAGSANHTNFPVLISGTYDGTGGEPDLRTVANGGEIQNTTTGGNSGSLTIPADLEFYSDSDLTTQLAHEIQAYDASTGAIIAWVKIPTLAYDSDTTIYMAYGDSGVSTSQEDLSTLWTDYEGVWHLQNTGTAYDSSPNGYDLTEAGTPVTTTGVFGNAIDFDGSTDYYYMNLSDAPNVNGTGSFTNQAWVNSDNAARWHQCGLSIGYDTNTDIQLITLMANGYVSPIRDNLQDASVGNPITPDQYSADAWYLMVHAYDSTAPLHSIRIRKLSDSSTSYGTKVPTVARVSLSTTGWGGGSTPIAIGAKRTNGSFPASDKLDGTTQETRFANVYRNTDWVDTEFNNQGSPSTFYTMGSETAVPSAGGIAASRRSIQA